MKEVFTPNAVLDKTAMRMLISFQIGIAVLLWCFSPSPLLPRPGEVAASFVDLWQQGMGAELITSLALNIQAIFVATVISLLLSYAAVMPFFRPIASLIGKLRFLSLAGLTFVFTLMTAGGHELKLSLLTFSVTVFFVTSMEDVLKSVPKEVYDLARVLHMSRWRVVWEVVILGQFDKVFDVIRQNAAMSWMMISLVEGIVRSEGGIGTVLLDQNHHFRLSAVFAIQITILLCGIGQDYALGFLKKFFCPYALLTVEAQ
jgi:NitT/TauT family transport system permease protein